MQRVNPPSTIAHLGRLSWRAIRKFDRDKGFFLAAALAFSILLGLIPLSLLFLSIIGAWLARDADVADHLGQFFTTWAPALDPQIAENLLEIVLHRRVVGLLGLAGLVWTSTMVFSSVRISLNSIFGVVRCRDTVRALAVDIFMIVISGSMLTGSMFLTSWIIVLQRLGERHIPQVGPLASFLLKYPVPLFFTVLMCFLVYKIAPNRRMPIVPALKAAFITGLLWETAKQLFGWYVLHLGRYSLIYGSLSAAAIFVLWIYYSAVIFLLGAELAHLIENPHEEAPRSFHSRRSFLPQ